MAGFDYTFKCKGVDKALGRALLSRTQRLARNFELEFRYNVVSDGWYVTVDGSLTSMQALFQPIAVQLMPFGEGFPTPQSIRNRRRIVNHFIKEYHKGLDDIREVVEEVSDWFGVAFTG